MRNFSDDLGKIGKKLESNLVLPKNDALTFLKRTKRRSRSQLHSEFKQECCNEACDGEEIWEMREETSKYTLDGVICEVALK